MAPLLRTGSENSIQSTDTDLSRPPQQDEDNHHNKNNMDSSSTSTTTTCGCCSCCAKKKKVDQGNTVELTAQRGDVVTLNLNMEPEHGFVPEPLFDTQGMISFVVGWGNYLPGLHQLVQGRHVGDTLSSVSIDAGYGAKQDDLFFSVPRRKLQSILFQQQQQQQSEQSSEEQERRITRNNDFRIGESLRLPGNMEVWVSEIRYHDPQLDNNNTSNSDSNTTVVPQQQQPHPQDVIVLDANPPLAGTSYACTFEVLDITRLDPAMLHYHPPPELSLPANERHSSSSCGGCCCCSPSPLHVVPAIRYEAATFALGCFWGGELVLSRLVGVVGTQVGYSQGIALDNDTGGVLVTYADVCTGRTKHREAVRVIYNPHQISYTELLQTAWDRLEQTTSSLELHKLFQESNHRPKNELPSPPQQQRQHEEEEDYHPDHHYDPNDYEEEEDDEWGSLQYRHGFYYHTMEQRTLAIQFIQDQERGNRFAVEVQPIANFYPAEDYHQQYLFKGGQSTKKGSKDVIQCFG